MSSWASPCSHVTYQLSKDTVNISQDTQTECTKERISVWSSWPEAANGPIPFFSVTAASWQPGWTVLWWPERWVMDWIHKKSPFWQNKRESNCKCSINDDMWVLAITIILQISDINIYFKQIFLSWHFFFQQNLLLVAVCHMFLKSSEVVSIQSHHRAKYGLYQKTSSHMNCCDDIIISVSQNDTNVHLDEAEGYKCRQMKINNGNNLTADFQPWSWGLYFFNLLQF